MSEQEFAQRVVANVESRLADVKRSVLGSIQRSWRDDFADVVRLAILEELEKSSQRAP